MALQPSVALVERDGRIVVTGSFGAGPGQVGVVRLLPNGRLDTSFGAGGVVTLQMFAANSLALTPDQKILVSGGSASGAHAEIVRLNADGSPDAAFGSAGVVDFDYVANSSNQALVVIAAAGGTIVAGGFGLATNGDEYLTSLARILPNGSLDATFGTNGVVAIDLVGGVTAIGLQSDGKILVCGGFISPVKSLVARFLRDGKLDRSDAGGSLSLVAHTGSGTFGGTNAFQPDGKLVQWTTAQNPGGNHHFVKIVRLLRDNSLDPSFTSREFAFDSPDYNSPTDVTFAADGALLASGAGSSGPDRTGFGLARLRKGGTLDPTFGHAGRVATFFSGSDESTALAVQRDGRIVSAGVDVTGSTTSLVLARYLAK
jgi:uncharacterized delta-60 repeat protein